MAPLITHLLVGERVYPSLADLDQSQTGYGAFLLGCLLVDVNHFSAIPRVTTHLRSYDDERDVRERFLNELPRLLTRPWESLSPGERSFIAGYLCHLVADGVWKNRKWAADLLPRIQSAQPPIPLEVLLTAFSALSRQSLLRFDQVAAALEAASLPDILTMIPYSALQRMWEVVRPSLLDSQAINGFMAVLRRAGRPEEEVRETEQRHQQHWQTALALIEESGGIAPYVELASEKARQAIEQLLESFR